MTTPDLRLIVITDPRLARAGSVEEVVRAALEAGTPAVQLRDKHATSRELAEQARRLLALTRRYGALLFINDRVDVALATGADGVHLGPDDLPVAEARRIAPRLCIGFSTDHPAAARRAVRDGADYIGCGAVFGTTSKPEVGGERIGTDRLAEVVDSLREVGDVPVVGIGGITADNAAAVARTGAAGCAVIGAVMAARDPGVAARELIAALKRGSPATTPRGP